MYSIIICTYNRCTFLRDTIVSILDALHDRSDFEIVIINNNSTDRTEDVVKGFQNDFVKYFLETKQGLSHARNRGLAEAKNDILVYLDDDIGIVPNYFDLCDTIFSNSLVQICGG